MGGILVVTPVMREPGADRYNGSARLYPRAMATLYNQEFPGQLDHYTACGGDNHLNGSATVTRKYEEARRVFLAGSWDYMFCAEADMVMPLDALKKLILLDADIGYALYVFRHSKHKWSAALELGEQHWKALSDEPERARAVWGQQIEVAGVGQGCTLIKRRVLETLEFHNHTGVSCDWLLAMDAKEAGFSQACDLSIVCGHMTITPSRQTYWPDINEPKLYRQEFPA